MLNTMFEYVLEHFPAIGCTILLVVVCVYATWKIRGLFDQSRNIQSKVDNLPCQSHEKKIDQMKLNDKKLNNISTSIRKIEEWIIKQDVDAMGDLVRKCSPYKLTELGYIMLLESGAKECVDENMDFFVHKLEETDPLTAYDVEKNALTIVSDSIDDPVFNGIKDFIYNSPQVMEMKTEVGEQEVKVDIRRILMIMSIYLRDRYFEKHTELDTSGFPKR